MPSYDYKCKDCGHVFEAYHGMNETPELSCPNCGSKNLSKLISGGTGVIFKGSGFYITDYKRSSEKSKVKESESEKSTSTATAEKTHTCTGACQH